MDLGILITLIVLAFGAGGWFYRIEYKLNKMDKNFIPLTLLHKEEIIRYYLEKGILPNPSLTPRRQYLIDKLRSGTISQSELQELQTGLKTEEQKAKDEGNTDAVVAILGLIALVIIIAALSKK
jgi:hypothetical protein